MNVRLLAGIPLVAHVIRTCQRVGAIDRIVVTTEDDEVAVVARRHGAEVVRRPSSLAEFTVPLAPVITDAVEQLEARGEAFDVVATVQPNNPLVRAESLTEGLSRFADPAVESVVSVWPSYRLRWRMDGEGRPQPDFHARRNRESLPAMYLESGGLLAVRRPLLNPDRHVADRVSLLVLDREEAVDIDTYHDWWMAEKILGRKRIVFHVIGSSENGLGHVYRALTLARRLSDHEVFFLCEEGQDLAYSVISEAGFDVHGYRESPIRTLEWLGPDIVVNDVLDTTEDLVRGMRGRGWRVVNFEDMGPGIAHADIVINALYEAPHHAPHVKTGAEWYCLREEFYSASRHDVRDEVRRILLCFGGTDPSRITLFALRALADLPASVAIDVVVGPGFGAQSELDSLVRDLGRPGVDVVRKTRVMSHYKSRRSYFVRMSGS
jgi:CMP-N-acetylneuraminic acid synthetase